MRTTYILGAGFSRYAGLPLLNDFFFKAKDIYIRLQANPKSDESKRYLKSFKIIFNLQEEYAKAKNYMNTDLLNFEELFSIIEMDAFISDTRKKKTIVRTHFPLFIQKVIHDCTWDKNMQLVKKGKYDKYEDLVTALFGNKSTSSGITATFLKNDINSSIISLNYDLVIEEAMKNISSKTTKVLISGGHTSKFYAENIPIVKIHGSLNYYRDKNNLAIEKYDAINESIPVIIPPTWNKTGNKAMVGEWQKARQMLAATERLVFIGYSLPVTDAYVKYLLINGLKECQNLKEIIVINPDDGEKSVENRYKAFFEKNFRQKAFKFFPFRFEQLNFGNERVIYNSPRSTLHGTELYKF